MSNFEQFNLAFPNSTYREVHPPYTGDTSTPEGMSAYQKTKSPIGTMVYTFNQIKDTPNRVGWIVPKDYVVVDIDNLNDARIVYEILSTKNANFAYMKGMKGGHFIFKNDRDVGNGAKYMTSLGITIDTRAKEKGYIILPHNDPVRQWGTITNEVDPIPFYLTPLKGLKPLEKSFVGMGEGDGRNDSLLKHFFNLKDYAKEIDLDEKIASIRLINSHLFKSPIEEKELQGTVLRDAIVNKPNKEERKKDDLEELAAQIIEDKQIISSNGTVYIYNGKYYRPMSDDELERVVHDEYSSKLLEKTRKEVIKFVKLKSWISPDRLNEHWNCIVVKNGILNISEMKLYPHSPLSYNTIYVNHNYNDTPQYSQMIDGFFNQISQNEEDKKLLLTEMAGYCFIRRNIFQKFFICFGEGSTGKSTYLTLIKELVGGDNTSYLSLANLEDTYYPAELFGKLVNLGDDIAFKRLEDASMLKKLVSGERIMAQQKYKQPISFNNFAKIIFSTNKLPNVSDRTTGFYRRLVLLEINKKITKPDPFFLDKLTEADYEYLFYEAIKAIRAAIGRNALTECASAVRHLQAFKTSQSSVLTYLSDMSYTAERFQGKSCSEAFAEYKNYCEECGHKLVTKVNFKSEICDEYKMICLNTTYNGGGQTWRFKLR